MTNTQNGVRLERIDDLLDYTDAFDYLQTFYGGEDEASQDISSKTFTTSWSHHPSSRPPRLWTIGNAMADITSLPKRVVIALAHSVRHLVVFGLSDSFKRTTFFSKFLTRSHMLLNANTLTNL